MGVFPSITPAPAQSKRSARNPIQKTASRQDFERVHPAAKVSPPSGKKDSPHIRETDTSLHLSEDHSLATWQNNTATNSLQSQSAALHTADTYDAAVQLDNYPAPLYTILKGEQPHPKHFITVPQHFMTNRLLFRHIFVNVIIG